MISTSWVPRLRQQPVLWLAAVAIFLSSFYWLVLASDRYVSEARVVLARSSLTGGQTMDFVGLLTGVGGSQRPDQLLLRDYLQSLDVLRTLDARLRLRQHYSSYGDWGTRLWSANAPLEVLQRYVASRISVELDDFSGALVISVQAYTPEMARAIATSLLEQGEHHMNELGHQLAGEQVRFLEKQVSDLSANARAARAKLLAFQNRKGLASPQATAENYAGIVARLESQLTDLQTRRTGLLSFLQANAPQVVEVNAQIGAIEAQLKQERARLTSPQGSTLNSTVEEYQRLQLEAEFAQQVLNTALVSLERGRVDATRTLKQVQILQSANLPEYPLRPRRIYNTIVYALGAIFLAGVLQLLVAIVRDHKD
jgi:capsular polysaccharide transport system permease protein